VSDGAGGAGTTQEDASGAKVSTTLKGSMGERITKALQKVEEKKKKRAERKAMVSREGDEGCCSYQILIL